MTAKTGLLPVLILALVAPLGAHTVHAQSSKGGAEYDQFLDAPDELFYEAGVTLVPDTTPSDAGDASQIELEGDWTFSEYENIWGGVVSLGLDARTVTYTDDAAVDLPNQLLVLAADVQGLWRYIGDYAFISGVRPGLYTDLEDFGLDGLAFPFYLYFIKTFTPSFSGILGLDVRPDWEMVVMPRVGVKWAIADPVSLELAVPETRLLWEVSSTWATHLGIEWHNTTYALADDDGVDRGSITLDYVDIGIGVARTLPDDLQLVGELGQRLDRSLEFEKNGPFLESEADVDDSIYLRFSVRRPF